ncbi:right-handed parallel beta-helix repeat-containing protein [Microbacterium indicum]|uniref:right-handed parallel beta-helix repeat-containing protein n=1 Tax=Microbacterium indicum TaxID=358100 RepID=UPI0004907193|nr:right-handed parallel beta-helix repeat-containing protein [Microbacterium indicum]
MTTFHVATTGSDLAEGGADAPFRTIGRAARVAMPGDAVEVHEGVYREWVRPARGGRDDRRRITYAAAAGEHVRITGSERVTGWTAEGSGVWSVRVPNALFGDWNPFAEEVAGDWVVPSADAPTRHLGDVYLNGRGFYEAASRAELDDAGIRTEVLDDWTGTVDAVRDPDQTRFRWFAEVGEGETTIWAAFHDVDPNAELVEINVRRQVFSPEAHGVDFITVRGFELAQAATPWAPPTADQPGLIGPNWARGWIIEGNDIHDAKCSAVSLGKERSTGHDFATERRDKPGYQYQLESVFSARQIGWDAEHIGSHIVRDNRIHDCGQNAVVGHLGAVFSTIERNRIWNIAIKREFFGHEIAGIKLHAAIDVVIAGNRIHDCSLGIWLDWQTQGTRITRNALYANSRDLFVEVSHGPYVADHNLFASRASLEVFSQGGAFLNNLVAGTVAVEPVVERPTPYHRPHSTQVAGYAAILGGDDRWIGNLFLAGDGQPAYGAGSRRSPEPGTAAYDGHPQSMDEYLERVDDPSLGDHERFAGVEQPVYLRDNVYAAGARAYAGDAASARLDADPVVAVREEGEETVVEIELPAGFAPDAVGVVTGDDLEPVRFVGAQFEDPDGSPIAADRDLTGARKDRGAAYPAGPFAALAAGRNAIRFV